VNDSAGDEIENLLTDQLQIPPPHALDGADESDERTDVRPAREGLPRSFRMRHDKHYVDELLSPHTPPVVTTPPQPSGLPALSLIAERLEALVAHADVIGAHSASNSLLAQTVHTEFARLARVARAAVIVQDGETPFRRSVTAGEIADETSAAIAPIARLAGMSGDVTVEDRGFTFHADPLLVVHAIAATVDAVTELLQAQPRRRVDLRPPGTRVGINVQSTKVRPAVIVDVTCPVLVVSARQAERFFENQEEDYRNAPGAGILLAAAAHVARSHGGRCEVKRNGAGTSITFVYPQTPSDTRLA
jgi:hypothetical protein